MSSEPIVYPMPSRSSDAGPDPTAGQPKTWRDFLDDAADLIVDAGKLDRDDLALEYRMRTKAIDDAIAALETAKDRLPRRGVMVLCWHESTRTKGVVISLRQFSENYFEVRTSAGRTTSAMETRTSRTQARECFERTVEAHYE